MRTHQIEIAHAAEFLLALLPAHGRPPGDPVSPWGAHLAYLWTARAGSREFDAMPLPRLHFQ